MNQRIIGAVLAALLVVSVAGASGSAFAAAGSPPSGPIEAPKTGADLKHACGQTVEGFSEVEGERMLREMLIVQCWSVVATVVDLVEAGNFALEGKPVWECVTDRSDHKALIEAYVKWVGRRPPLMRQPAPVAFVQAVEMSAKCKN